MMFDLDHVGIAVRDLDRAAIAYRRLGFTLTDRSFHMGTGFDGRPVRAGTGNHCLILGRGYIELIAPTEPGYAGRLLGDLDRYEGLHLVSLGTADGAAAETALSQAAGAPATRRIVTRPFRQGGQDFKAAFDIIDLPAGLVDEAHVFAIHHLTPDVIWQPALMRHANGATNLQGVTMVAPDAPARAARLARLFGGSLAGARVTLAAGWIDVLTPSDFAARYPGATPPAEPCVAAMTLAVADLRETAAALAGIADATAAGLRVAAADACGVIIDFNA